MSVRNRFSDNAESEAVAPEEQKPVVKARDLVDTVLGQSDEPFAYAVEKTPHEATEDVAEGPEELDAYAEISAPVVSPRPSVTPVPGGSRKGMAAGRGAYRGESGAEALDRAIEKRVGQVKAGVRRGAQVAGNTAMAGTSRLLSALREKAASRAGARVAHGIRRGLVASVLLSSMVWGGEKLATHFFHHPSESSQAFQYSLSVVNGAKLEHEPGMSAAAERGATLASRVITDALVRNLAGRVGKDGDAARSAMLAVLGIDTENAIAREDRQRLVWIEQTLNDQFGKGNADVRVAGMHQGIYMTFKAMRVPSSEEGAWRTRILEQGKLVQGRQIVYKGGWSDDLAHAVHDGIVSARNTVDLARLSPEERRGADAVFSKLSDRMALIEAPSRER